MAYEFSAGPKRSARTIEQVGNIIKTVGSDRRFMSVVRRMGVSLSNSTYGAFSPQPNDDPFASARRKADWRVGWRWAHSVTNSMGMTLNQGWEVIFDLFDEGSERSVTATVHGAGERREVEKFVRFVFDAL